MVPRNSRAPRFRRGVAKIVQRSVLLTRREARSPMPNRVFWNDLSSREFFQKNDAGLLAPSLSVVEKTSAENQSHLCARTKARYGIPHTAQITKTRHRSAAEYGKALRPRAQPAAGVHGLKVAFVVHKLKVMFVLPEHCYCFFREWQCAPARTPRTRADCQTLVTFHDALENKDGLTPSAMEVP